jgi:hypothetical protein
MPVSLELNVGVESSEAVGLQAGGPGLWLRSHGQSNTVLSQQLGSAVHKPQGHEEWPLREDCKVSCEIGTSQRGLEPWNTEAEESTTLGAVIR